MEDLLENKTFWNMTITESFWDWNIPVFPSGYSGPHLLLTSVVVTFIILIVVIGNAMVIIAIATDRSLKGMQYWFIASLAVSDLLLGLTIMPFSLAHEVMGYWIFGTIWCEIHGAIDVMLSTASIMNLCLISLDRYWSITRAIEYLRKRTPMRVTVMITMVWILSGVISIPPLLGWKVEQKENSCQLSEDKWYVLYSALGSFYIPSCIMVFVYVRIYLATRARAQRALERLARRKSTQKKTLELDVKAGDLNHLSSQGHLSNDRTCGLNGACLPPVNHKRSVELLQGLGNQTSLRITETIEESGPNQSQAINPPVKVDSRFCEDNREPLERIAADNQSPGHSDKCSPERNSNMSSTKNLRNVLWSASDESTPNFYSLNDNDSLAEYRTPRGGSESGDATADNGTHKPNRELQNEISPSRWSNSTQEEVVLKVMAVYKPEDKHTAEQTEQPAIESELISELESCDSMVNTKCSAVKPLRLRLIRKLSGTKQPAKLKRQVIDLGNPLATRDPAREKRRIARKREKRATLILGLIMGAFILCWLPFFVLYIISPFCLDGCKLDPKGFAVAFWLGYCNSALNPVIYTIFNKDFRKAFRKILLLKIGRSR